MKKRIKKEALSLPDTLLMERSYRLGMPQMLFGGLSENWLLKEFGDLHWDMITKGLGVVSDALTDSRGERLYASFVRLRWQSDSELFSFEENQELLLKGKLSRYGSKMFFSDTIVNAGDQLINAELMSVFSSRSDNDNTQLKKGAPLAEETEKIRKHQKLPLFAKTYLDSKTKWDVVKDDADQEEASHELGDHCFSITSGEIYSCEYTIDPFDDVNGVGLLYFASYPKISDKCERQYFQQQDKDEKDWSQRSSSIGRDIFYFGNANPGDVLIYKLESCDFTKDGKVQLCSSLYRKKDAVLIARIFTLKKLKDSQTEDSKQAVISREDNLKTETKAVAKDIPDRDKFNNIVSGFLSAMLEIEGLDEKTDLSLLGIESVVYMELSEHLNNKYGLASNPSRFYGLKTVNAISGYLLGASEEDKQSKTAKKGEQPGLDIKKPSSDKDMAIVGYSFRLPGAATKEEFWELLKAGRSSIAETPGERWDWPDWIATENTHKGINKGGYIKDIDGFDASFFRISSAEAELMDPQQRLLLELSWELLENSACKPSAIKGSKTGVYIGASGSDYELVLREQQGRDNLTGTGTSMAILANRLSYFYDLEGPSLQLDTACSSSLVAIHEAINAIRSGQCTQAIVGGIHLMCHPSRSLAYYSSGMLSEDGKCHTFDESANGYVRGEGAVMMMIKPLEKALEAGDLIKGVIKGTAVNHGGQSGGLTVPNPKKQQKLLESAYTNAGVDIHSVSYIEAHGTGTSLGDPIEVAGLTAAFESLGQSPEASAGTRAHTTSWCGIGSVKTNIGHLEAAAGMAGMLKVLLAMEQEYLPPTVNFKKRNPKIELENSPFYIQNKLKPWKSVEDQPLRAGVSSFGIGGANAHIILESYKRAPSEVSPTSGTVLIPLSAKSREALTAYAIRFKDDLERWPAADLYTLAYTMQSAREEMEERVVFVAKDLAGLQSSLHDYIAGKKAGLSFFTGSQAQTKKILESLSGEKSVEEALKDRISRGEHSEAAILWAGGMSVDWSLLYASVPGQKTDKAPVYPFQRSRYWISPPLSGTSPESAGSPKRERLHNTVVELLSRLIHLPEKELDDEELLMDYGITSVAIIQLANQVSQRYGLDIKATDLYNHLTIQEIVDFLFPLVEKNALEATLPDKQAKPALVVKNTDSVAQRDFAIIGLDISVAGAKSPEAFWELLVAGDFKAVAYPEERWERLPWELTQERSPVDYPGSFLDNILGFDHRLFKLSVRESMLMDPQQRLLLQSVWSAIENAGYTKGEFSEKPTSVYLALNALDYTDLVKYDDKIDEFSGNGISRYIAVNRISHFFDLKGKSEPVNTACSSFFIGLERAIEDMKNGLVAQAVISGVQLNLLPFAFDELKAQGLLSETGRTLTFDQSSDGFVRAEGVGTLILKPLDNAINDKDYIHGIIKGVGAWHAGRAVGMTTPNANAHQQAMLKAISQSGVDVNSIGYIEAHGTGMSLGDASEIKAFSSALKKLGRDSGKKCIVSASKPTLGHLEAASGIAVITKAILSLNHGKVPGVGGFKDLHQEIPTHEFIINDKLTDLPVPEDTPPCIGLNSYGLGGVSAFVVMEQYAASETGEPEEKGAMPQLFVLSAQSEKVLERYLGNIGNFLKDHIGGAKPGFTFGQFIKTCQLGREAMKYRLAIISESIEDLHSKIEKIEKGEALPGIYFTGFQAKDEALPGREELVRLIEEKNWEAVAMAWTGGAKIPWKAKKEKRFPFPGYPFNSDRKFWISRKEGVSDPLESEPVETKTNGYLMLADD